MSHTEHSQSTVNDLAWSPKHACIFACTNDSYLEIWNLQASTLDPVHVETVCADSTMSAVRFTEGSDTIMVGDSLGTVYRLPKSDVAPVLVQRI
nr:unnamed protein product [Spirometra erinaceieuropaei]